MLILGVALSALSACSGGGEPPPPSSPRLQIQGVSRPTVNIRWRATDMIWGRTCPWSLDRKLTGDYVGGTMPETLPAFRAYVEAGSVGGRKQPERQPGRGCGPAEALSRAGLLA